MAKKIDRRVRRTRSLLANALLALILECDYETITIQDITERADLNRATFYLHYGSREELLVAALEARFDEVVQRIEARQTEVPFFEDYCDIQMMFEHVQEHAALYEILLGQHGNGYIINRMIDYMSQYGHKQWGRELEKAGLYDEALHKAAEPICYQIGGSLYGLVVWWLRNGMPQSPEEISQMAHQQMQHGAKNQMMGFFQMENLSAASSTSSS